jgi:hypothetical protein
MAKTSSTRNQRNNPYLIEGWAVNFHRSPAGIAWRWRTELILLAALLAAYVRLAAVITALWALITLTSTLTAALAIPQTRRGLKRRAWCLISRHRLQRVCYETRMHTPGRTASADHLDPPDQGRRTRPRPVPRRDLRR